MRDVGPNRRGYTHSRAHTPFVGIGEGPEPLLLEVNQLLVVLPPHGIDVGDDAIAVAALALSIFIALLVLGGGISVPFRAVRGGNREDRDGKNETGSESRRDRRREGERGGRERDIEKHIEKAATHLRFSDSLEVHGGARATRGCVHLDYIQRVCVVLDSIPRHAQPGLPSLAPVQDQAARVRHHTHGKGGVGEDALPVFARTNAHAPTRRHTRARAVPKGCVLCPKGRQRQGTGRVR